MLRTIDEHLNTLRDVATAWSSAVPSRLVGRIDEPEIVIIDDALADPLAYRDFALSHHFSSVTFGPAVFHGLAQPAPERDELGPCVRCLEGMGRQPTLTFFRQSPEGTPEPNLIHLDTDMGEWTAILYLSDRPPIEDGTTFWRHRATGFRQSGSTSPAEHLAEALALRDLDQWEPWRQVAAVFNRVVVFPACAFHSRAMRHSYGQGASARLIQVMFGRYLPCA